MKDVFKEDDIGKIVNINFNALSKITTKFDYDSTSKSLTEKAMKFGDALDLCSHYVRIMNKLHRAESRKALLLLLTCSNVLPTEIIKNTEELNKLLLLSFNEAEEILKLTGNKTMMN